MLRRLIMVPALLLVAACTDPLLYLTQPHDDNLTREAYRAADKIVEQMPKNGQALGPIIYTTFVDIHDLDKTSRFGQMMAETVSSRLTQRGYDMEEVRLRNQLGMNKDGEFMLSRDFTEVAAQHQAWAALVGTYASANDKVMLNVKVVDLASGTVGVSYDVVLDKGDETEALLGEKHGLKTFMGGPSLR